MAPRVSRDFFKVRNRIGVENLVTRIADVLDRLDLAGRSASASHLRATAERVRQGRFVVLLLGSFSTGKSTLLNALLGAPVLPVKVNPCTAILTEIVWSEEPRALVAITGGCKADRRRPTASIGSSWPSRSRAAASGASRVSRAMLVGSGVITGASGQLGRSRPSRIEALR